MWRPSQFWVNEGAGGTMDRDAYCRTYGGTGGTEGLRLAWVHQSAWTQAAGVRCCKYMSRRHSAWCGVAGRAALPCTCPVPA